MRATRMRLNPTKTQEMWFIGSTQLTKQVDITDISFQFWRHMSKSSTLFEISESSSTAMLLSSAHVAALRQLRPLSDHSQRKLPEHYIVHAFVSCRLNYCNSFLYGLPDNLPRSKKLQSVQIPERCHTSHHRNSTVLRKLRSVSTTRVDGPS